VIPLELEEIARLCPGRLEAPAGVDRVTGLEIDSRSIEPGDLFVAIRGGVEFVGDALERGAAAALVPDDSFQAMAALGRAVRKRAGAQVVAITGATGKTSTKDILAALCRPHRSTIAAEQSHNNEIGLPLTLTRMTAETEIAICEMGTRGPGQVAELCDIAKPHLGVIAQIGPAHLELFGTVERVAAAEAEVVAALPVGGTIVVPAGEALLDPHLEREDVHVVTYGEGGDIALRSFSADEHAHLEIEAFGEVLELEFNFRARHNAVNALAALAAYRALGLPLAGAQLGALSVSLSRWREEERALPGGGALINDCYNANPVSMAAALAHLAERSRGRRRVAVLGDMAELGPEAPAYHGEVGAAAGRSGVAVLIAVGPLAHGYLEGATSVPTARWVETAEQAVEVVQALVRPGDCVLVKGSRAVGLETVVDAVAAAPAA
jgi:UDP-N-acetylmuramoyl-tripeptide--D-alanyl-D-alanine ligase